METKSRYKGDNTEIFPLIQTLCLKKMNEIAEILSEAKSLAKKYRMLTGKPLGITGEVGEFSAAQILGLELAEARQSGYDAIRYENEKK